MAPEIFISNEYGTYTDIWASGIILFEMLFGYNPFNKCKDITELKKTLDKFELVLPNINKSLSPECISFLRLLLEKNNTKRTSCISLINHEWFSLNTLSKNSFTELNNICNTIKISDENNKTSSNESNNDELNETHNTNDIIDTNDVSKEEKHDIFNMEM